MKNDRQQYTTSQLLTIEEAANWLQITKRKTQELVRLRKLSAIKIGRQVRLCTSDLETFVNALRDKTQLDLFSNTSADSNQSEQKE